LVGLEQQSARLDMINWFDVAHHLTFAQQCINLAGKMNQPASNISWTRAAKMLGIGRVRLSQLIKRGDFALDGQGRILREQFLAMIANRKGISDAE
jgi:hypothetical protein